MTKDIALHSYLPTNTNNNNKKTDIYRVECRMEKATRH